MNNGFIQISQTLSSFEKGITSSKFKHTPEVKKENIKMTPVINQSKPKKTQKVENKVTFTDPPRVYPHEVEPQSHTELDDLDSDLDDEIRDELGELDSLKKE